MCTIKEEKKNERERERDDYYDLKVI